MISTLPSYSLILATSQRRPILREIKHHEHPAGAYCELKMRRPKFITAAFTRGEVAGAQLPRAGEALNLSVMSLKKADINGAQATKNLASEA
jgi:hypothetical protein